MTVMNDPLTPFRKAKREAIETHGVGSPKATEASKKLDQEWQRLYGQQDDTANPTASAGLPDDRRRRAEESLAPLTRPGAGSTVYRGSPLQVESVAVEQLDEGESVEREAGNTQVFQLSLDEPEYSEANLPNLPDPQNAATRLARICMGAPDIAEAPSLQEINRKRNHALLALFD